ncbi:hypothetical protein IAU60_006882 [Kwoniella sp. DSM 27419]
MDSFLVGVGVVNFFPVIMGLYLVYFATIVASGACTDKVGRRPLLLGTSFVCAATLIITSVLTTAFPVPGPAVQKACIGLIFIWYASFGAQSPLVWIVTAEAAPTRNREKVLGIATFGGFGIALIILFVSPYLQDPGFGNLGSKILDYLYAHRIATRKFKGYHFEDEVLASEQIDEVVMDDASEKKAEA